MWATQRDIGSEVARNILSRKSQSDLRMLRSGEPERVPSARKLLHQVLEREPDYLPGRVWLGIADSALKRQPREPVATRS